MRVGFIGFGEVSSTISKTLLQNDIEVLTYARSPSLKTQENIKNLNIISRDSLNDLTSQSDFLIIATSPSSSYNIAEKIAPHYNKPYLDLNNISPTKAIKTSKLFQNHNYIDAAIIGKINNPESIILLSGEQTQKTLPLMEYLDIKIISNKIGDASQLKMLRSKYTKTVSALLVETFNDAEKLKLSTELLEILKITEGEKFEKSAKSRIKGSQKHAKRKAEEIQEIEDTLGSSGFLDASKKVFQKLK